ncbi:MAG TPA: hypothetical protein VFO86_01595 [Terriglobia bacterium]|nr:hypothetical protein [Terriglobia bacterium]
MPLRLARGGVQSCASGVVAMTHAAVGVGGDVGMLAGITAVAFGVIRNQQGR